MFIKIIQRSFEPRFPGEPYTKEGVRSWRKFMILRNLHRLKRRILDFFTLGLFDGLYH